MMAFIDIPVARFFEEYGRSRPSWLKSLSDGARHYGQAFSALLAFLTMLSLDPRRRKQAILMAVAVIAAALITNVFKLTTGRARPRMFLQEGQMWSAFKGFSTSAYAALPSAHTASAFALSGALSRNYPRGAWVFLAAAALCGASRVFDNVHYISDVFLGGLLGLWLGYGVYRWRWSISLADSIEKSVWRLRPDPEGGRDAGSGSREDDSIPDEK